MFCEPQIFASLETVVSLRKHQFVLLTPDLVNGIPQMLGHMELIESNALVGLWQVGFGRLDVCGPHVHGDALDAVLVFLGQGVEETVEAFRGVLVSHVEHGLADVVSSQGSWIPKICL